MADTQSYFYMRIKENFFDGDEIKILESMPDGYLYSNILLKMYLNSLKNSGRLMLNEYIPYSPEMIASITRHQIGTVQRALDIFKKMGLIEVLDNGAIYMLNIQQYIGKSSDEADRKREYRQRIEAEKKALLGEKDKCPTNVREISDKRVAYIDTYIDTDIELKKDIELDTDIELKKNTELNKDIDTEGNISAPEVAENVPDEPVAPRERIDYTSIMNLYNSICVSFPVCRNLSDNRKKMIKACFKNGIKEEDFERAFRLSEDSPFLKGMNNRGWSANFDWIIKPNNIVKILDGNYTQNTNTPTKQNFAPNSGSSDSLEDFYDMASKWANKG